MRHEQSAAALIKAPVGAVPIEVSADHISNTARRLAVVGGGHLVYGSFNHFFDYVLYPFVVYTLGAVAGGAVMTLASLLQCALTLIVYQRLEIDWVGGGLVDDLASTFPNSRFGRLLNQITGSSRLLTFFGLCAITDPFIVTAFFRRGRFHTLTTRDWNLFFASVVVCNLYWIMIADLIAHGAVALWNNLLHWLTVAQGLL